MFQEVLEDGAAAGLLPVRRLCMNSNMLFSEASDCFLVYTGLERLSPGSAWAKAVGGRWAGLPPQGPLPWGLSVAAL